MGIAASHCDVPPPRHATTMAHGHGHRQYPRWAAVRRRRCRAAVSTDAVTDTLADTRAVGLADPTGDTAVAVAVGLADDQVIGRSDALGNAYTRPSRLSVGDTHTAPLGVSDTSPC